MLISFGSIILVQYLGGSALTAVIVPVITFIFGSVFKNPLDEIVHVRTQKVRKRDMGDRED